MCVILVNGCGKRNSPMKTDSILIAEVNQVISHWHGNAAKSDHAAYIGAMASGGIYIGTDANEYWTTKEFSAWSKPYFEQKNGWNLVSINRHIYLGTNRETAWFDELLDTSMGLCRGSGVLQKIDGRWQICQYVLSPTMPNELTNEVKRLKAQADSLLIQELRTVSDK